MNAGLVHCTLMNRVQLPESMAPPRADQMQGSVFDQLGEVACRICYDSMGTGRSSEALHRHIRDVINLSVYEHINYTVAFPDFEPDYDLLKGIINRKGVWFEPRDDDESFDLTVNARAVIEWERHTLPEYRTTISDALGEVLWTHGHKLAPMVFQTEKPPFASSAGRTSALDLYNSSTLREDELSDEQIFVTLWLYGSRGFTHEQVRHRFAISQRSTRYVDESESPYIEHPVITEYLNHSGVPIGDKDTLRQAIAASIEADRHTYDTAVEYLEDWFIREKGQEKTPARKQARGAARGYLGNALASEMLFTTNIPGWQWILKNRKNKLADAEIREIYTPGLKALQSCIWGHFNEYTLEESPDGIGTVLAEA